jgi:hypothetical protein
VAVKPGFFKTAESAPRSASQRGGTPGADCRITLSKDRKAYTDSLCAIGAKYKVRVSLWKEIRGFPQFEEKVGKIWLDLADKKG